VEKNVVPGFACNMEPFGERLGRFVIGLASVLTVTTAYAAAPSFQSIEVILKLPVNF
jgi:hypothetical protein